MTWKKSVENRTGIAGDGSFWDFRSWSNGASVIADSPLPGHHQLPYA